jgi:hypothetical protein
MKILTSACLGFAIAVSAFALTSAPSPAFEIQAVTVTSPNNVIRIDESEESRELREREESRERWRREAREYGVRCERARRECRERHGQHDHEFYECVVERSC